jgi:hypothetical protein
MFKEEKMTFVLNSNDEFYEGVYENKTKPVRVYIHQIIDKNHLSKSPIGYVDLNFEDWKKLDSYLYIGNEDVSKSSKEDYNLFRSDLIKRLERENKFLFYN